MGLWEKFIEFKRKSLVAHGNIDSLSLKSNLLCPKCKVRLYQLFSADAGPLNNYICRKCSYTGPTGLQIEKRKSKSSKKK